MKMKSGYSKDKKVFEFTPFTLQNHEGMVTGNHCKAVDRAGNLRDVKITSIRTWKRNPNIEIHWKYGLYEYGWSLLTPDGFKDSHVILGTAIQIGE